MASTKNDFIDFLGLFTQPLACRAPSQELLTLLWSCVKAISPIINRQTRVSPYHHTLSCLRRQASTGRQ